MGNSIEVFDKRWNTVCNETLSAVRSEFNAYIFDNTAIDRAFQTGCSEWFDGSLGPSVWYENLVKERPDVAQNFKDYVTHIDFQTCRFSKPSRIVSYALALISLPACFFSLDWWTKMTLLSKILTSLGTSALVWYASQAYVKSKDTQEEDRIVDFYRHQLDEHLNAILKILA